MVRLFLALLTAGGLCAAEHAILQTGFVLLIDRHELAGDTMRLHTGTGVIEVPASAIVEFEPVAPVQAAPAPPADSPSVDPVPQKRSPVEIVEAAASRYGLPPALLHSVARVESAYRPDAISPKGAIGIMQLMPGTAAQLNADPHDPEQNVEAGARHLRELLIQYNGETMKALAAYNAGAGAVTRYNGVPPYRETQNYIEKVLRNYWKLSARQAPALTQ
jgi:soluble lytic murein transglycosylase-like protein